MGVKEITAGERNFTLKDVEELLFEGQRLKLSARALKRVNASYQFLSQFSKGKLIYGINTGFGPMAQHLIPDRHLKQLQYNLIRSHAAGSGDLLEPTDVKALMIARLSSILQGKSGVHTDLPELLIQLINRNIYPEIYSHGGVGASGDLVQLAHLALALVGEGDVSVDGKTVKATDAFKKEKLKPLKIYQREGIAIMNGTSAMSGIGMVNLIYAKKILNWAVILSAMMNEIAEAFDDPFSEELNTAKQHPGQAEVAGAMRAVLRRSRMMRTGSVYRNVKAGEKVLKEKVQEYYSLRCVPQILGAVYDTVSYAGQVVMNEVNSSNDNPVIDHENENVYHGGNFHGDYVALEMDKLKIAITKVAMLAERQLNYLLNDKVNQKLPPFLNSGVPGLNYGAQGMQFTATSTTAECQTLCMPAYIHSIPNNNDNQDIVSMGTNAALITRKVITNTFEVLAVHAIAVAQAVDCLDCSSRLSPYSKSVYEGLRGITKPIGADRPMHSDIRAVRGHLLNSNHQLLK